MESGRPLDAVFLDTNMPGLGGLSMLRALSRIVNSPSIVFVTARDDHTVSALISSVVDHVLKPISRDHLAEAVRRVALRAGHLSLQVLQPEILRVGDRWDRSMVGPGL